jgi:chromosome segregation ATPase
MDRLLDELDKAISALEKSLRYQPPQRVVDEIQVLRDSGVIRGSFNDLRDWCSSQAKFLATRDADITKSRAELDALQANVANAKSDLQSTTSEIDRKQKECEAISKNLNELRKSSAQELNAHHNELQNLQNEIFAAEAKLAETEAQ